MSETNSSVTNEAPVSEKKVPIWKKLLFSDVLLEKSYAKKIAYVGVMAALSVLSSMYFEFKFLDVQFSLTICMSVLAGLFLGSLLGGVASFLGDFIGYIFNSWGLLYYWWVALSSALMAVVAGLVARIPLKIRGSLFVKLALICLFVFVVCSVGVNTTGFYVYYSRVGFSQKAIAALQDHFGGANTYVSYVLVRFLFLGQLWNSLVNYALLFALVPALSAIKPLRLGLG